MLAQIRTTEANAENAARILAARGLKVAMALVQGFRFRVGEITIHAGDVADGSRALAAAEIGHGIQYPLPEE